MPAKRIRYTFWIEPKQADALKAIHERDGILPSEQIRRAIDAWLVERKPQGTWTWTPAKGKGRR